VACAHAKRSAAAYRSLKANHAESVPVQEGSSAQAGLAARHSGAPNYLGGPFSSAAGYGSYHTYV